MTWTCTKCQNVTQDTDPQCLNCFSWKPGFNRSGADRPAELSEEERAGFDALVAAQAACGEEVWSLEEFAKDAEVRKIAVAFYRAACAPLEAEMAKLRERVRALEMEERNLTAEASRLGGVTRSNMEAAGRIVTLLTGEAQFLETMENTEAVVREKWTEIQERVREAKKSASWWEDEHNRERDARHAWVAWARENGAVATGPDAEPEARRILKKKLLQRIPVGCPADGMSIREIGTELRLVGQWHENETTAKDAMGRKAMYLFTPITSQAQLAQQKPAAPAGLPEVLSETLKRELRSIWPKYCSPRGNGDKQRFEVERNPGGNLVGLDKVDEVIDRHFNRLPPTGLPECKHPEWMRTGSASMCPDGSWHTETRCGKCGKTLASFGSKKEPPAPAGLPEVGSVVHVTHAAQVVWVKPDGLARVRVLGPFSSRRGSVWDVWPEEYGRLPPALSSTVTAHYGTDAQASREPFAHAEKSCARCGGDLGKEYDCLYFHDTCAAEVASSIMAGARIMMAEANKIAMGETAVSPPAQTSREPGATVVPSSVENHLNVFAPAASPPGEVTIPTPNLEAWMRGSQPWESMIGAAQADIRAAVERETAKDKARIAKLTGWLGESESRSRDVIAERDAAVLKADRVERTGDAALAEVERLKGELARAKEFQATVRDADRRLRFTCEANVPPPRRFYETVMAAMAKLEPAPAQPECKVQSQPQDEVFCGKCHEVVPASMTRGLKECRIHGEILNSERTDAPKRCGQCLGRDPGAKGRGETMLIDHDLGNEPAVEVQDGQWRVRVTICFDLANNARFFWRAKRCAFVGPERFGWGMCTNQAIVSQVLKWANLRRFELTPITERTKHAIMIEVHRPLQQMADRRELHLFVTGHDGAFPFSEEELSEAAQPQGGKDGT